MVDVGLCVGETNLVSSTFNHVHVGVRSICMYLQRGWAAGKGIRLNAGRLQDRGQDLANIINEVVGGFV